MFEGKNHFALVAQLDRATDYESVGREFESLRARQTSLNPITAFCGCRILFNKAVSIADIVAADLDEKDFLIIKQPEHNSVRMGDGKGVVLLEVAFQVVGLEPFIEGIFPENRKTLL